MPFRLAALIGCLPALFFASLAPAQENTAGGNSAHLFEGTFTLPFIDNGANRAFVGQSFKVTPVLPKNDMQCSIASNGTDFLVVYRHQASDSNGDIYGVFVESTGVVGTPFLLEPLNNTKDAAYPVAVYVPVVERFVVAWEQKESNYWKIYAKSFGKTGQSPSAPVIASDRDSEDHEFAATLGLAQRDGASSGDVVLSYTRNTSTTFSASARPRIMGKRIQVFSSSISPASSEVEIDTDAVYPSACRVGDNRVIITYQRARDVTESPWDWDIYARMLDSAATKIGSSRQAISTVDGASERLPSIAHGTRDSDRALIVWQSEGSNGDLDIFGASSTVNMTTGAIVPTIIEISVEGSTATPKSENRPSVAWGIDPALFIVSWESAVQGVNSDILCRPVDLRGASPILLDKMVVDDNVATQVRPEIHAIGGLFLFGWEDSRNGPTDIFARLYAPLILSSVTPASQTVGSAGSTTTISVTNNGIGNLTWSANENSSWLTVSPLNGDLDAGETIELTVTYTTNAGPERIGNIVVTGNGALGSPISFQIKQKAPPILEVTPTSTQNVGPGAGTLDFSVKNAGGESMNWTVTRDVTWPDIVPSSGPLNPGSSTNAHVTYSANPTTSTRSCTFTFTAPGAIGSPKSVTVTQAAGSPVLSVTPTSREVGSVAGITTFEIKNTGIGTLNWSVSEPCGWLQSLPSNGALGAGASQSIDVSYGDHSGTSPRSCELTFTASGATNSPLQVTVTQRHSAKLSVSPGSRPVGFRAGSTSFEVKNIGGESMNWSAAEGLSWLSLQPSGGTLNPNDHEEVVVNFTENDAILPRSGQITVTAPGAVGSPDVVTINQNGGTPELIVNANTTTFGSGSGNIQVFVVNSGIGTMNWSLAETCGWLTPSATSGTLGAEEFDSIDVSYTQNDSGGRRECELIFSADGTTIGTPKKILLSQKSPPKLLVSPDNQDVGPLLESTAFEVANGGDETLNWSVSKENGDWITLPSPSGTIFAGGNAAQVQVNCAPNPTTNPRVCELTFSAPGADGNPRVVTVTQEAGKPALHVEPVGRTIPSAAGTTKFTVKNSGVGVLNWSVSENSPWISSALPSNGALGAGQTQDVIVSCDQNGTGGQRTSPLSFTASGATGSPVNVNVTQMSAAAFSVTPTQITVGRGSGSYQVSVRNNGGDTLTWSVSEPCDWLTVSPPNGNLLGGQTFAAVVSYTSNSSTDPRVCRLTFTSNIGGGPFDINIAQSGVSSLTVTPDQRVVDSMAGSTSFVLRNSGATNYAWTATVSCNWLTSITPTLGNLNPGQEQVLNLTFSENVDFSSRACVITVQTSSEDGTSATIPIYQNPGTQNPPPPPSGCAPGKLARNGIVEGVFPVKTTSEPIAIAPNAPIMIRLSDPQGVVPGSVWAKVDDTLCTPDLLEWRPIADSLNTDGWIVVFPDVAWPESDTFRVEVGGLANGQAPVDPISHEFRVISAGVAHRSNLSLGQLTKFTGADPLPEYCGISVGDTYHVLPQGAYANAVSIAIPVPEGEDPANLTLCYFSESNDHRGWFPAHEVKGWLKDSEIRNEVIDGQQHVVFEVNHSGVLQLGKTAAAAASGLAPNEMRWSTSGRGWLLVFAVLALAVFSFTIRRSARQSD